MQLIFFESIIPSIVLVTADVEINKRDQNLCLLMGNIEKNIERQIRTVADCVV